MIKPTIHATKRSAQRNIPIDSVDYIIDHSKPVYRSGVIFYYLRDRDIPARDWLYPQIARLAGTAVILSQDRKTIITLWRDRKKGMKYIRRKKRYDTSGNDFLYN
jgi:hypothetical protein